MVEKRLLGKASNRVSSGQNNSSSNPEIKLGSLR
jgi:hypothetical protein